MTELSAKSKVQRLLRVFHRSGREGEWTRPFDSFPEDVRAHVLDKAALRPEELPVLAYFREPARWVLLTTERVVMSRPERASSLSWGEIANATVDPAHVNSTLTSSPDGKLALNRLRIQRRAGEDVELELEAGAAFYGFWNVLKTVANLGKE